MKKVEGDLIEMAKDGEFNIIIHGYNCFHTMGAGVALAIKKAFPDAFKADLKTGYGDRGKLGSNSYSKCGKVWIANAYIQYQYGKGGPHLDYKALSGCLANIKRAFSGCRIGLPQIGAGLTGGDWEKIEKIIEKELDGEDVTVVLFRK